MKCRLIHFRLFAEYLTGIFFVASGIVVLSAYFRTEAEDDIFRQERTVLLVVGIIHLAIFVQCLLSCAYTTKLLRYVNATVMPKPAPRIFCTSVDPIRTGEGRLSPPITTGTPNVFHLPAPLNYLFAYPIMESHATFGTFRQPNITAHS